MKVFDIPSMTKDVYKEFHVPAYHPAITKVYANYVSRSGKYSNTKTDFTVFGGLQGWIIDFLLGDWQEHFFNVSEDDAVYQHGRILSAMLGYKVDTSYLRSLHQLGYLPLRIKALPEGTFVPYQVSPVTIENTVEGFQWLTNMIETAFSTDAWAVQTSLTTSVAYYTQFIRYARETGLDESFAAFQGHDFSARGLFGRGAWPLSGLGHLMSGLVGTDTVPAVVAAERYYGANVDNELVGCSVNATEHSVTCSWQEEGELAFYRYLMHSVAPTGILSLVFDTWDFWNGVTSILPELKQEILTRDGTIVIRPDSGDPVKILTGYTVDSIKFADASSVLDFYDHGNKIKPEAVQVGGKWYELYSDGLDGRVAIGSELMECEVKGLIECLWDIFGGTETLKGYKLLNDKIGAIYGDSITLDRQEQILSRLKNKGFASKVVLGIGSYTYQYVTRDTHGSAIKATNVLKSGVDFAIAKEPKTDIGKKSAKGLLRIERIDGKLVQFDQQTREQEQGGLLEVVFEDGKLLKKTTLQEIRATVKAQIDELLSV
ncbi:nicotinate phosphoribosyltransferase [Alishewanella phage vB_AspM_Slicko01]|nr:nicotinate phosphoribosyltransferase [Alishewanella phage vB_AspM_Slicko01]